MHRAPLIEKYRRLMDELSNKKVSTTFSQLPLLVLSLSLSHALLQDDTKQKMEKIKEMRRLMAEIAEDVKQKEERYKQVPLAPSVSSFAFSPSLFLSL